MLEIGRVAGWAGKKNKYSTELWSNIGLLRVKAALAVKLIPWFRRRFRIAATQPRFSSGQSCAPG